MQPPKKRYMMSSIDESNQPIVRGDEERNSSSTIVEDVSPAGYNSSSTPKQQTTSSVMGGATNLHNRHFSPNFHHRSHLPISSTADAPLPVNSLNAPKVSSPIESAGISNLDYFAYALPNDVFTTITGSGGSKHRSSGTGTYGQMMDAGGVDANTSSSAFVNANNGNVMAGSNYRRSSSTETIAAFEMAVGLPYLHQQQQSVGGNSVAALAAMEHYNRQGLPVVSSQSNNHMINQGGCLTNGLPTLMGGGLMNVR